MKIISFLLFFTVFFAKSCQSQSNNSVMVHYKAETRGFSYTLNLKNNTLEQIENGVTITKNLSAAQINTIEKQLAEINFSAIKSNLQVEETAVDRAIPGYFEVEFNNKKYQFEFSHHNLPNQITNVIDNLKLLLD